MSARLSPLRVRRGRPVRERVHGHEFKEEGGEKGEGGGKKRRKRVTRGGREGGGGLEGTGRRGVTLI